MRNGNLAKNIFYLLVFAGLSARAFLAGILFTAVKELQEPSLRIAIWVMGMLLVFSIIHRLYNLVRFIKKNPVNWE